MFGQPWLPGIAHTSVCGQGVALPSSFPGTQFPLSSLVLLLGVWSAVLWTLLSDNVAEWNSASLTSFLNYYKHFVIALQENTELRSFLSRLLIATLLLYSCPTALFPCLPVPILFVSILNQIVIFLTIFQMIIRPCMHRTNHVYNSVEGDAV